MKNKDERLEARVVNLVVGYIVDYDRRKSMRTEYDERINNAIDQAFAELDSGLRPIIMDDLCNSVGWAQSKAANMCCHTYYFKQKRKVVRLIAKQLNLTR